MTPEQILREHLNEAQDLFDKAKESLEKHFDENKDSLQKGELRDLLVSDALRNEFTDKYPPHNTYLVDQNGNARYNSIELDRYIFKLYYELLRLPENLVNRLE